jgi:uncharacterized membrane protein HdeD (DUF308 family)
MERTERSPIGLGIVDADVLARNWWLLLLRGFAGVLFGVLTFIAPGISLAALVLLFGAYALVDGVFSLFAAIRRRSQDPWWLLVLRGITGIAAGVLTLLWPGITALALLYVVAAWALVGGGLEIAAAIRLRKVIRNEWLLVLGGLASLALGTLLVLFPGPGALALVLWIGAYAIVSGALMIALAIRLRTWGHTHAARPAFSAA